MLREENKRAVRVRVCGDLARYMDDEDFESAAPAVTQPLVSVVIEQGKVFSRTAVLSEESEEQAA